jgi:hypothetical protein
MVMVRVVVVIRPLEERIARVGLTLTAVRKGLSGGSAAHNSVLAGPPLPLRQCATNSLRASAQKFKPLPNHVWYVMVMCEVVECKAPQCVMGHCQSMILARVPRVTTTASLPRVRDKNKQGPVPFDNPLALFLACFHAAGQI